MMMQRTAVLSLVLVTPLTALFFFVHRAFGLPFPAFNLMDFLIRVLPGDVITFGIDRMTDVLLALQLARLDRAAKNAEGLMAALLFVGVGGVAGWLYIEVARRLHAAQRFLPTQWLTGIGLGFVVGVPLALISAQYDTTSTTPRMVNTLWIGVAVLGWGLAHNWIQRRLLANAPSRAQSPSVVVVDRRRFLIQIGGASATLTVVGAGLGALLTKGETITGGDVDLPELAEGLQPAPGTRPEYTPLQDHYRIDINSGSPPVIEEATWRLKITGLIDVPQELTLADLRTRYTPRHQFVTLSCISNRIGGRLIGTTRWTGFPLRDLLADLGLQPSASHIRIRSVDGFDEVVDIATAQADERVMLCYEWDGVPLPDKHGFPLRIYIPGHYGMKQPKWITDLEVTDRWQEGYWVRRNWSATAYVKTTSVIDTVALDALIEQDGQTLVPIGGIAYSGDRGISRVEVRVDDGEWAEADLRQPLSETTWVIWRYDWPFAEGKHTFTVRAYEADGTPQIEAEASPRPDGATGYHRIERG